MGKAPPPQVHRVTMKKYQLIFYFIVLPSLCFGFNAKVVNISDGDTVTVVTDANKQVKIRLYGIDTPEKGQAFGQKAKEFTSKSVSGKNVTIEEINKDRYGRTVGIISANGSILNEELIKNGLAWHYGRYCNRPECNRWKQYELQAQKSKIGLWAESSPTPPWDFRKNKRENKKAKQKTTALSDDEIKKRIIQESIASYPGNCPCPYNAARNGSRCGGRSAWSRKGGYSPICFENEVTDEMVDNWIKNHTEE